MDAKNLEITQISGGHRNSSWGECCKAKTQLTKTLNKMKNFWVISISNCE